jgi:RNA polymerase sigma-70 factor (ECF subfamily)
LTIAELEFEALSEEALLALYVEGDARALEALLKRREKWLWNVAKKSIRDVSLAEEALQEALVSIWKNAHTFRGESQLSSWLYQIVSRTCIDVLRKEKLRAHSSLELVENLDSTGPKSTFEEALVDQLLVHSSLLSLEPDHRAIIELVDLQGRSVEEVSQILGIPLGTVKSRAARARDALKKVILKNIGQTGNQNELSNVIVVEVKNAKKRR